VFAERADDTSDNDEWTLTVRVLLLFSLWFLIFTLHCLFGGFERLSANVKTIISKLLFDILPYTVSQKVPTFKLSVTLSKLNRFSNVLRAAGKRMEFATRKLHGFPALVMLLHYLGE